MTNAFSEFCFDKFVYVLHPDLDSTELASKFNCGNCYSFAYFVLSKLKTNHGISSFVITGNVPPYFMKKDFWGLCHAAVFVPSASVILDPSVYAPPIPVRFDGHPSDEINLDPETAMGNFADKLFTVTKFMSQDFTVPNPLCDSNSSKVPKNTFWVKVFLKKNNNILTAYDYVLRPVQNFDKSITKHVHSINQRLFRQNTTKKGHFQFRIDFLGDNVKLIDYRTNNFKIVNTKNPSKIPGWDDTWQIFFDNIKYSV